MNKIGTLDIIKAYLGTKELSANNAYIGEISLIKGSGPTPVVYPGLKFTSTGNSTISMTNGGTPPDMKYSLDGGSTWTQWDYSSINLNNGQSVIMKGNNPNGISFGSAGYSKFVMTGSLAASGNIMSLIDNGSCLTLTIPNIYCFYRMFLDCTSLTSAPELPATTLASYCYYSMFRNCSITSAPELPATTLASYCYSYMFRNCSSLTSAPELPATTLANNCYLSIFDGCTNLSYIKCLATTRINQNNSTANWVSGVASTGTFIKNPNATWPSGVNGIPSGWTIQNI